MQSSSRKSKVTSMVPALQTMNIKDDIPDNPFVVPLDHDIFALRDKEKQTKKEERQKQRSLKVHEKTTYSSRMNARTKAMTHPDSEEEEEDENEGKVEKYMMKDDPEFVLLTTKDRHVEKEHLDEYIAKKREMFLVQYSLGVKRDEMRKLEEITQAEEKKLELAEQYLEEDASLFDEFLKDNDKNAVEAIKIAETETKAKLEKVAEIKKINAQMMAIKSDISKNEDLLKEYVLYKSFLEKLTPPEVLSEQKRRKLEKRKKMNPPKIDPTPENLKVKKAAQLTLSTNIERNSQASLRSKRSGMESRSSLVKRNAGVERDDDTITTASVKQEKSEDDFDLFDEEPELYFKDPVELLDIFAELEEQNLSLIQNSQDTEEALDDMKRLIIQTKAKMNKETDILKNQIETLKETSRKEEEKANELEMKSRMFSFGEFKAEDQEKTLAMLNRKVEDVYRYCIGSNEANLSTLQMLTNIENRLEELFEMIELMPPDKVELAEKAKDKERRLRLREEKMLEQKRHQEERIRKAIERAQAEPKKKTGRRLVFRSCPPQTRKREDITHEKQDKEEEELKYFFT